MTSEQYGAPAGVWGPVEGGREAAATHHAGVYAALAGGVLALLISAVLGYRVGHNAVPGLQQRTDRLVQQLAMQHGQDQRTILLLQSQVHRLVASRGSCPTYDGDVRNIQRFLTRGQYQAAADLANLDLVNPNKPACPGSGLAQLWYTASMDGLFATAPQSPADTSQVLAWRSIEARGDRLGLGAGVRISPLTIATMAYTDHQWALCRAAFQRAWQDGLVGPDDLTPLSTYYAATRNQGREVARTYRGTAQQRGYVLLRTAALISRLAGLQRGEADADLQGFLGPRARTIQPDTTDPVLAHLAQKR